MKKSKRIIITAELAEIFSAMNFDICEGDVVKLQTIQQFVWAVASKVMISNVNAITSCTDEFVLPEGMGVALHYCNRVLVLTCKRALNLNSLVKHHAKHNVVVAQNRMQKIMTKSKRCDLELLRLHMKSFSLPQNGKCGINSGFNRGKPPFINKSFRLMAA